MNQQDASPLTARISELEAKCDALKIVALQFRDGYRLDHERDGRWIWFIPGRHMSTIKVETRPDVIAALDEWS